MKKTRIPSTVNTQEYDELFVEDWGPLSGTSSSTSAGSSFETNRQPSPLAVSSLDFVQPRSTQSQTDLRQPNFFNIGITPPSPAYTLKNSLPEATLSQSQGATSANTHTQSTIPQGPASADTSRTVSESDGDHSGGSSPEIFDDLRNSGKESPATFSESRNTRTTKQNQNETRELPPRHAKLRARETSQTVAKNEKNSKPKFTKRNSSNRKRNAEDALGNESHAGSPSPGFFSPQGSPKKHSPGNSAGKTVPPGVTMRKPIKK